MGGKGWGWKGWLITGLVLIGAALAAGYVLLRPTAVLGTGYVAQRTCSCLFVSGRGEGACARELGAGTETIGYSVDDGERSVTASVYGLYASTATHRAATGCQLAPL